MKFLNENRNFLRIAGIPFLCLLFLLPAAGVYARPGDSIPAPAECKYAWIKPALAPAFLGTSALLIHLKDFPASDADIREWTLKQVGYSRSRWDDYVMFTPIAMAGALRLAGVKSRHSAIDQSALLLLSLSVQGTVVYALKYATHVKRPDGSSSDAFPSGHSAFAFSTATFMHLEYGSQSAWYSLAAYVPAVAVGANRILRDRHWASDVLLGAACGIALTRSVYWVYPKIKDRLYRTLHVNNLKHGITFD